MERAAFTRLSFSNNASTVSSPKLAEGWHQGAACSDGDGNAAGTPLKAWFADISGEHQDDQVLAFQEKCLPCGYFERNNGPCHFVRVVGVR